MTAPLLAPVIALVLWSFVIWGWMYATRIPAILKMKMVFDSNAPRGEQMNLLPANVRWKADNYNHLMEQPTLFYAIGIVLALIDPSELNAALAWAYVGVRVAHSVWQSLANIIQVRFALFSISALLLIALTVRAALALLPLI